MRQYAAALEGIQAQTRNVGAMRTKPGTIDALVVSYLRSVDWTALKRELRIPHGDKPGPPPGPQPHQEPDGREGKYL
jgi:hypothetical protein